MSIKTDLEKWFVDRNMVTSNIDSKCLHDMIAFLEEREDRLVSQQISFVELLRLFVEQYTDEEIHNMLQFSLLQTFIAFLDDRVNKKVKTSGEIRKCRDFLTPCFYCQKESGHDGVHQDGYTVWYADKHYKPKSTLRESPVIPCKNCGKNIKHPNHTDDFYVHENNHYLCFDEDTERMEKEEAIRKRHEFAEPEETPKGVDMEKFGKMMDMFLGLSIPEYELLLKKIKGINHVS